MGHFAGMLQSLMFLIQSSALNLVSFYLQKMVIKNCTVLFEDSLDSITLFSIYLLSLHSCHYVAIVGQIQYTSLNLSCFFMTHVLRSEWRARLETSYTRLIHFKFASNMDINALAIHKACFRD